MSESIQYKKHTIEITPDNDPINPCEDWDMFGMMVCFHGRYTLGHYNDKDNIWSKKRDVVEFQKWLEENKDQIIYLPLYLYDHSGITISTTRFSCPWDSGKVGVIFITKEKVRNEFGVKRITKKVLEKVYDNLRNEVANYDDYLTGNVYGYIVKDNDGEEIDSCWGYFGHDHEKSGLLENAKAVVDYELSKIGEQTELELVTA